MKSLWVCAVIFIFTGCSTTDNVREFRNLDMAIEQSCQNIQNDFNERASIAVFNVASSSAGLSEYIIEEVMNNFTNMHKYNVVERSKISAIFQEQNFQFSGNVSDDTIQRLGNMLGAQFVVTGSLDDVGSYYRLRLFVIAIESSERKSSTAVNVLKPNEQIAYLSENSAVASSNFSKNILEGIWEGIWYGEKMRIVFNGDTTTWYGGWASGGIGERNSSTNKFKYENGKYTILNGDGTDDAANEVWTIILDGDNLIIAEDEFLDSGDMDNEDYGHFKKVR